MFFKKNSLKPYQPKQKQRQKKNNYKKTPKKQTNPVNTPFYCDCIDIYGYNLTEQKLFID